MKTLLIGGLAALSIGGVAMAQDGQRGPRAADSDGDGRISQAEFVAGAVQRFDNGDANRDGTLTADEVRAGMEARRSERRDQMFARMDANGDGSISRAEFDARPQRGGDAERGGRGGGRHGWGRGGRGHRGGGGEMMADGVTRAEAQSRAEARFARMDSNNDGFLTQEDRQERRGRGRGARSE
ncbi:EF-hand domain-containing protein [Brevundimonas aveniformis]|uniref:EF-hand domain-containing protein n=1 Tax=Brevundimonas aveniformis TaxID=370977 RepID=UPI00146FB4D0|nr:EF-hand domain-containing protein [Brevundimonas aveniformis]